MGFSDLLSAADAGALSVLGAPVTYTPTEGDPVEVQGKFDATHVRVDVGTPGISSQGPALFLRLEDLPSDPEEDDGRTVTVDAQEYSVHDVRKDGIGGVTLFLHLAP